MWNPHPLVASHSEFDVVSDITWPNEHFTLQVWPRTLQHLRLPSGLVMEGGFLLHVRLPPSLTSLVLGYESECSLHGLATALPHLRVLHLSVIGRVRIDDSDLPPSLLVLYLGQQHFADSVEHWQWAPQLKKLHFDHQINRSKGRNCPIPYRNSTIQGGFNQPIGQLRWPVSLRALDLTYSQFNQPIAHVAWQDGLHTLQLSSCFNQPVESVRWPSALRQLEFLGSFNVGRLTARMHAKARLHAIAVAMLSDTLNLWGANVLHCVYCV